MKFMVILLNEGFYDEFNFNENKIFDKADILSFFMGLQHIKGDNLL